MVYKWSADLTKTLISLYELQPVLYKVNSPNYHNKVMRHCAIESIRKELMNVTKDVISSEDILKKINNLRSQFLEALRQNRQKLASGSGADSISKPSWWLFDHMQFLLPYCKADSGVSNIKKKKSEPSTCAASSEVEPMNMLSIEVDEADIEEFEVDTEGFLSPVGSEESSTSVLTPPLNKKYPSVSTPPVKKKKKEDVCISNVAAEAIRKIANDEDNDCVSKDVAALANFIKFELAKIKNKKKFKDVKWKLLNILQAAESDSE